MRPTPRCGSWPVLVLIPLALAGCKDLAPTEQAPPRPIVWTEVRPADQTTRRILSAVVRPVQRAPLSFEVGGRVEELRVEVGDRFVFGQVLGQLDQRLYALTRQERDSEVVQAKAVLREADQAFERQRELHGRDWASEAAFDTAKAALETARARLETARARLDIAEENLADTVLRAPYAGVVARRLAEPAQRVAAGETVLEIQGDGGGFEIAVAVPETLVARLQPGAAYAVTFPAPGGASARARVTEIGTEAEPGGAFPVTLRLETPRTDLRAGMTAEVAFDIERSQSPNGDGSAKAGVRPVAIPVTAFLAGDGPAKVAFVFEADGRGDGGGILERRTIRLGPLSSEQATVLAGLSPGEIIATRGLPFLRDGQRVTRLGVGPERYQ